MIIIGKCVVSEELFSRKFVCNLTRCKGACCWEGDLGAPLSQQETENILSIKDEILTMIDNEARDIFQKQGPSVMKGERISTPLKKDGSCIYLLKREDGSAKCGFEVLYHMGRSDFIKPISCHLYPVRVSSLGDYDALNYDEWDICHSACELGEELKMPVFRFLKKAMIRKYGEEFYEALEDFYKQHYLE